MNSSGLLQFLGSAGVTTVLVTVISGIMKRKQLGADVSKTGADATKVLSETAVGLLERAEKDNERLRLREAAHDRFREEMILKDEEWRRVLQVHAAWDALAQVSAERCDPPINLPPAPPLTPPTITRDHSNGA